jgi:hypothetical protein
VLPILVGLVGIACAIERWPRPRAPPPGSRTFPRRPVPP